MIKILEQCSKQIIVGMIATKALRDYDRWYTRCSTYDCESTIRDVVISSKGH